MDNKRLRLFGALRSQSFACLWIGQTVSAMGNDVFSVALAWEVLVLTGSATIMAVVMIAQEIPRIVFLLIGGAVADRLPRRLVLLYSDAGRAILVFLVAVLAWLHLLQMWHLVLCVLLFGIVRGFFGPAYRALLPQLVEARELLPSVNALNGLAKQLSQIVGPLLGAALFALAGPVSAFVVDALTFVFSACFLLAMRSGAREQQPRDHAQPSRPFLSSLSSDIGAGLRYVGSIPWLWLSILIVCLANLGLAGPQEVALPRLIGQTSQGGVWLLGGVITALAVGALLATLVLGQIRVLRRKGLLIYLSLMLSGGAFLLFGLPVPSASVPFVFLIAALVFGVGDGVFAILWEMALQTAVPAEKLGRVSSIYLLGAYSLQPLGFALAGIVGDHFSPGWTFLGGGLLCIVLAGVALSMRSIRQLD